MPVALRLLGKEHAMHYRRPRIKQEKTTFEERLGEEQRLKDEAEGMKRTLTRVSSPDRRSEGSIPLDEIFGAEFGAEESAPVKREPLVGEPNLKPQMLLSEKIVLTAASVAVVLMYLLLYGLIGTE
jgi:hypothetical protein